MLASSTSYANSASMPCDGDDMWDHFALDLASLQDSYESAELHTETVFAGEECCSATTQSLIGTGNVCQSETFGVYSTDQEIDLDNESIQDFLLEILTLLPTVNDFNAHFFRNLNVTDLDDRLVERIRAFYEGTIANTNSMSELIALLNEICLKKGPLTKALACPSMPTQSLKALLIGEQTSQARTLLLSLVLNHAMSLVSSNVTNAYFLHSQFTEEFGDLWQEPPSETETEFLTKCMGLFKIVQNELQLDCGGKKGMVIKAAMMIADSDRTYSNGGSQSKCIQILEGMFHRITDYQVKPRKRSADEMDA